MGKDAKQELATINVDLPRELHRAIKAAAALAGKTLNQAAVEALSQWAARARRAL